jgi:hypothetical protein
VRQRAVSALAAAALTGTLVGCASPTVPVDVDVTTTPLPMPTLVGDERVGCDDVVPPEDVAKYTDAGWVESRSYVDQLVDLNDPLSAFVDRGGVLCAWGVPVSDHVTVMGAGPIDGQALEAEKQRLVTAGFDRADHNGAELYRLVTEAREDNYLFVPGHWFYGSDLATADRVRLRADLG